MIASQIELVAKTSVARERNGDQAEYATRAERDDEKQDYNCKRKILNVRCKQLAVKEAWTAETVDGRNLVINGLYTWFHTRFTRSRFSHLQMHTGLSAGLGKRAKFLPFLQSCWSEPLKWNFWSSQTTPSSDSDTSLVLQLLISVAEGSKLKLSLFFFFWVTWLAFKSTTGRGNGCSNWQFMYITWRLTRWSNLWEVK